MKRMLFNATQSEELRVAIVDGQKLIDLDIESVGKEQRKSNIYKGVITRVEPSLEACFVDYGCERHGFLPFKEIIRAYLGDASNGGGRGRVMGALHEGQELIVQVEKDERGNKGAALTTDISLAGRYLVLMPNNTRGGGVSRRIEGEERNELRAVLDQLDTPHGMSLIARTAAIGRSVEDLQWDLNYLLQLWTAIEGASQSNFGLIYQESSLVIRAIRDYFQPDIGEILIDKEDVFEQAQQFMSHVMPGNVNRVKLYKDDVPLFSRFQIEHQIETAYSREVALPSGGAIVIDRTEALWSVDVNSARSTKGGDIEETAVRTNLEAADEIARQLRLRDMGGLIVIDFIDMENTKNQRDVENRVRDALHHDRARVQTGKISRFGLMELSRQRLQPSLEETSHMACPRCHGTGFIRGIESSALHILRIIQEEAMKENTGAIHAQVPVDVATFLLNEKRAELFAVEARLKVGVVLIPNMHLETPNYTVTRLRHDDLNQTDENLPSYRMVEAPVEEGYQPNKAKEDQAKRQEAVVKGVTPAQPAPISARDNPPKKAEGPSLLTRIINFFKGEPKPEEKPAARNPRGRNPRNDRNRGDRSERGERQDRNRNERGAEDQQPRRNGGGKPRIEEDLQPKPPRNNRGQQQERGERAEKQERPPRAERAPRPQPVEQLVEQKVVVAPEAIERSEGSEPRRRRRRRGEKRDRNEQTTPVIETADTIVEAPQTELVIAQTIAVEPVPAPAVEAPVSVATTPIAEVVTTAVAVAPAAPIATQAITAEVAPVQVAEPVAAPAKPVKAPVVAAPIIEIGTPEEAGLEMVSTRTVEEPAAVVLPVAPARRRRRDTQKTNAAGEAAQQSLQLVETASTAVAEAPAETTVSVSAQKPATPRRRKATTAATETPAEAPLVQIETQQS